MINEHDESRMINLWGKRQPNFFLFNFTWNYLWNRIATWRKNFCITHIYPFKLLKVSRGRVYIRNLHWDSKLRIEGKERKSVLFRGAYLRSLTWKQLFHIRFQSFVVFWDTVHETRALNLILSLNLNWAKNDLNRYCQLKLINFLLIRLYENTENVLVMVIDEMYYSAREWHLVKQSWRAQMIHFIHYHLFRPLNFRSIFLSKVSLSRAQK